MNDRDIYKNIFAKVEESENLEIQNSRFSENKSSRDLQQKTFGIKVPAIVRGYWMGKIKSENKTLKRILVDIMVKKYGLPENWEKKDL